MRSWLDTGCSCVARRSGPQSRAYSRNVVRTNEIERFVIITFWNAMKWRRLNLLSRFGSGWDEVAIDAVFYAA